MKINYKVLAHFSALALICGGFILAAKFPGLDNIYQTFVIGILTATGLYHGSDFGAAWLSSNNAPQASNLVYNEPKPVAPGQLPPPTI